MFEFVLTKNNCGKFKYIFLLLQKLLKGTWKKNNQTHVLGFGVVAVVVVVAADVVPKFFAAELLADIRESGCLETNYVRSYY